MITPAGPCALIRRGQQGIDFGTREEWDQGSRESLAGNGQHPLDLCGMCWRLEGRVTKEGMDRRQAQIAAANAESVALLQIVQETPRSKARRSARSSGATAAYAIAARQTSEIDGRCRDRN